MRRLKTFKQRTPYSCGAARVRSLVLYWEKIEIPEAELRQELNTAKGVGTYGEDIIKFFRRRGYKVNEKHGMTMRSVKYWLVRKVPVLVAFQDHWWLVFNMDEAFVYLMENEIHAMEIVKFQRKWFDRDPDGIPYAHYGIIVRR